MHLNCRLFVVCILSLCGLLRIVTSLSATKIDCDALDAEPKILSDIHPSSGTTAKILHLS